MESANLDLVRSIVDAWERGDFSSIEWAAPDIEFQGEGVTYGDPVAGLAAVAKAWRDYLAAWQDFRAAEVEEYRELSDERVLVALGAAGRGRASGLDLGLTQQKFAAVFQIRNGKVKALRLYPEGPQGALADLGLAPEGDSA